METVASDQPATDTRDGGLGVARDASHKKLASPTELLRRLDEPEFRELARVTNEQMGVLDRLAKGGEHRRGDGIVLAAIRTKLEYAYSKPKQETELSGNVTIVVQSAVPVPSAGRAELGAAPSKDRLEP